MHLPAPISAYRVSLLARHAALLLLTFALMLLFASVGRAEEAARAVHVIFFTPADIDPPPGVERRLTQVADYTERFLVGGLNEARYEPANKNLFERDEAGRLRVLFMRGEQPKSSGMYDKPGFQQELIKKTAAKYSVPGNNHVWWIFVYLGDAPVRFSDYRGSGTSLHGGWAILNYDSAPGEIEVQTPLAGGFNQDFTLKAVIHELGHGFGLPHWGPLARDRRGNTLMGPQTRVYHKKANPKQNKVYLTEASAAMLWKHPIFSGTTEDIDKMPTVKLASLTGEFNRTRKYFELEGKLESNMPAHSVIVVDDKQQGGDAYWRKTFTSRVREDGTFSVRITELDHAQGILRIIFCFENGIVTGNGKGHGLSSGQVRPYAASNRGVELKQP